MGVWKSKNGESQQNFYTHVDLEEKTLHWELIWYEEHKEIWQALKSAC